MWILKEDAAKAAKYKRLLYNITGASFNKEGRKSNVPSDGQKTTVYKLIDKKLFDEYLTATPLSKKIDYHACQSYGLYKESRGCIVKIVFLDCSDISRTAG